MNNNQSIRILRGTSEKIVAAQDKTELLSGLLLYNLDKNYLTVGDLNGAKITKKPIAVREVVGYVGDFKDDATGLTADTTEQWSIRYQDGVGLQLNNQVLHNDKQISSATVEGIQSMAFGGTKYDSEDDTLEPTCAEGNQSFAFGGSNHSKGDWSLSGGTNSTAYLTGSVAIGLGVLSGRTESEFNSYYWNPASNTPDNKGMGTSATNILDDNGASYSDQPHYGIAFGNNTKALGRHSIAGGEQTTAEGNGSISIGYNNESNGEYSITLGKHNQANSFRSIALGYLNTCNGIDSIVGGYHSEVVKLDNSEEPAHFSIAYGNNAKAKGKCSLAFGLNAISDNDFTFTLGDYVTADTEYQMAVGVNNKTNADAIFIVGNGSWAIPDDPTSEAFRSNAFEVLRSGGFNSLGDSTINGSLNIMDDLTVAKNIQAGSLNISTSTNEVDISDGRLYVGSKNTDGNSIETKYDIHSDGKLDSKSVKTNEVEATKIECTQVYTDYISNSGHLICNSAEFQSRCLCPEVDANLFDSSFSNKAVVTRGDLTKKLSTSENISIDISLPQGNYNFVDYTFIYDHPDSDLGDILMVLNSLQLRKATTFEKLMNQNKRNYTTVFTDEGGGAYFSLYETQQEWYKIDILKKIRLRMCYEIVNNYWYAYTILQFNYTCTNDAIITNTLERGLVNSDLKNSGIGLYIYTDLDYTTSFSGQSVDTVATLITRAKSTDDYIALIQSKDNPVFLPTARKLLNIELQVTDKYEELDERLTSLGFKQESVTCNITMVAGSVKYNTLLFLREGNFYLLKFDWGIDTDKNSTDCIIRDYKNLNSTTISVTRPTWMPKLKSSITTHLLSLTRISAQGVLDVFDSTVSCTINNDTNNSNNLLFTISIADNQANVDYRVQRVNGNLLISMSNNLKFDPMSM